MTRYIKNTVIEFFMTFLGKNYWKWLIEYNFDIKLTLSFKELSTNYKKTEKQLIFLNIISYYRKCLN
jgi:hypothetical protein